MTRTHALSRDGAPLRPAQGAAASAAPVAFPAGLMSDRRSPTRWAAHTYGHHLIHPLALASASE